MNRKHIRLTSRGWVVSVLAVGMIAASWIIGIPDMFVFGAALASLVLGCLAVYGFWAGGQALVVSRQVPARLTRGESVPVTTMVPNLPAILQNTDTQLIDNAASTVQITKRISSINRVGGKVTYLVKPNKIGTTHLGPLTYQVADPFDLVHITRQAGPLSRVVVTPRIAELPATKAFQANAQARGAVLTPGLDDSTLREYAPGDDLRRIHWPTTARIGKPMIRENGAHPLTSINLLLDPRLLIHAATREWGLEHLASVGCALLRSGYQVRLLGVAESGFLESEDIGREQLLNRVVELANIKPNSATLNAQLASQLEALSPGAQVYAVLSPQHGLPLTSITGTVLVMGNTRAADEEVQRINASGLSALAVPNLVAHHTVWAKASNSPTLTLALAS